MKTSIKMPSYMPAFRCIAGACEETCCGGWYLPVDGTTYKKYKKVKHPEMKKRLDKEIVAKKGQADGPNAAKIKLKNNRCAFLEQDQLCGIYKALGEHYLSESCKVYPRNINEIGGQLELSLVLSCPEAARRVLLETQPMTFIEREEVVLPVSGAKLELNLNKPKRFEDFLIPIREVLISILQERTLHFIERWQCLEAVLTQLSYFKQKQDVKKLSEFLNQMKKKAYLKFKGKPLSKEYEGLITSQGASQLVEILVAMRAAKKWPSQRYEMCYEKMITCLGTPFNQLAYQTGEAHFEAFFMKEHPYILENYFVNYIYERIIPLDQKTPLESFSEMTLQLALIKLHLIGMLDAEGKMTEEGMITCIQGFSRVFDHNALYKEQMKKQLGIK